MPGRVPLDRDDLSAAIIQEMGAVFTAALAEALPALRGDDLAGMEQRLRRVGRAVLGPVVERVVERVVAARAAGVGDGARTRLVVVGPVARAGSRGAGAGAGDALVASEARVTYHGDVAHLCGVGAAYVRDSAGVFGPGTQGLHLDMVVDGVTLLAQADIWTASAAYHVVGRLVAGPGPDAGGDLQARAL